MVVLIHRFDLLRLIWPMLYLFGGGAGECVANDGDERAVTKWRTQVVKSMKWSNDLAMCSSFDDESRKRSDVERCTAKITFVIIRAIERTYLKHYR